MSQLPMFNPGFSDTVFSVNSAPISSLVKDVSSYLPSSSGFSKLGSWVDNALTGQRDYDRQLALMGMEQAFNAEEAQKQRDFEERMRKSSYQDAVADLRAAGLNPYLAYGQGGAVVPSGQSASVGSHGYGGSGQQLASLLGFVARLVATGAQAAKKPAQITKNYYLKK